MYIWRKRATAEWVSRHTDGLERRFDGALALIERPGKRQISVEVACGTRKEALQLQHELGGTIENLRTGWLKQLAKQTEAKPLRVGSRLIVNRSRTPIQKDARTIVIPAEAAFGTGEHTTTAMCLRMLERLTRKRPTGWPMLDAGTGSGILAIAAACLGAKRIVAIDNDPLACRIARRNADANGVHIVFRSGDILKQKFRERFDVITANLFSEILIAALASWRRLLVADGVLILSGILRSQEPDLRQALRNNRFALREIRRRGKWIAILAAKKRENS